MSLVEIIKNQKTHIVYGGLLIVLLVVGYNFFSNKPKEIVKTQIETKIEYRDVVKVQKEYVDRVIIKQSANGDVTTTTEKVTTDASTTDKSKTSDTFTSTTVITYASRYSLEVRYPVPLSFTNFQPTFNPKDLQVSGGIRVFNSPIFLTLGTNVGLDTVLVGIRLEF